MHRLTDFVPGNMVKVRPNWVVFGLCFISVAESNNHLIWPKQGNAKPKYLLAALIRKTILEEFIPPDIFWFSHFGNNVIETAIGSKFHPLLVHQ